MLFEFGFYSSILLINFVHSIAYSILIFFKTKIGEDKSGYWLSIFLLLCSLYIAPWMLGFAGWYDNQPYRDFIFYFPFQQLFFIGPVIYFYTKSLLNPSFRFTRKDLLHLFPGIFYLLYSLWMWIYDQILLGDYYFYKDGIDRDFDFWYQKAGLISMIAYLVLSIKYYTAYKKMVFQVVSYANDVLFQWIRNYLVAFLIMLILPVLFDVFTFFLPNLKTYIGSWWYFLCFSIITYYIAICGFSNAIKSKIFFRISVFETDNFSLFQSVEFQNTEGNLKLEHTKEEPAYDAELNHWKPILESAMLSNKLYENPELSLPDLAKTLNTNSGVISRTINNGFQKNFNDFVNDYRIEAVKDKLSAGVSKNITLLGIAYDCGFNSKATFNRAFKKKTGKTPKEFMNNLSNPDIEQV